MVKRLTPKNKVLLQLYAKSGNVCAFPSCTHPIINADGLNVAQICHIEAAEEGGPRFNPNQTNEDRRKSENLLIMCYPHHKETDDVQKYPVEKMREIKRNHEAKFEKALDALANDIYDVALAYTPTKPNTLQSLVDAGFIEPEEESICLEELNKLINSLHKLPPTTRKIFLLFLERLQLHDSLEFPLNQFIEIISLAPEEAYSHITRLEEYNLLHNDGSNDPLDRKLHISIPASCDHPIAVYLADYCEKNTIALSTLIVDLNFSLLEK